jgi:hypothetical protein
MRISLIILLAAMCLLASLCLDAQEKDVPVPLLKRVILTSKELAVEPQVARWLDEERSSDKKFVTKLETVSITPAFARDKPKGTFKPFDVELSLFDHKYLCILERETVKKSVDGVRTWTWSGHLKDVPGSSATISYAEDGLVNATIQLPKAKYAIRPAPAWKKMKLPPLHVVVEVNDRAFPGDVVVFPKQEKKKEE